MKIREVSLTASTAAVTASFREWLMPLPRDML